MTEPPRPRLKPGAAWSSLPLTAAEGFAVSRIDGSTSPHQLTLLTGLTADQVDALLSRLRAAGVLESAPKPSSVAWAHGDSAAANHASAAGAGSAAVEGADPAAVGGSSSSARGSSISPARDGSISPARDGSSSSARDGSISSAEDGSGSPDAEAPESAAAVRVGEPAGDAEPTLLRLYRQELHGLPEAERVRKAASATDARLLSALCFDPLPSVVRRLLENPHCGPEQARLIATHHPTATGLDLLLARADLLRDAEVQRKLWRNPQLAEGQVRRLTAAKRLLEVWKLSISREATAQVRAALMRSLRAKFPAASAEERVELIFTTEGRCLGTLAGLPIDGRTTALLCARTYSSVLLISNVAGWAPAPPLLIAHLLKQPLVMRQATLRKKLELHPNAPHGPH